MPSSTSQMILTLKFRYQDQSWSERFNLGNDVASYNDAFVIALVLLGKRKAILPDNCKITRAAVSFRGRPREAKLVQLAYPIAGTAATATTGYTPVASDCNDVENCVHVRYETASGRWTNEYVRCLPDDVIEAKALVSPVAVVTSAPTPPLATWYVRMEDYLFYLQRNCVYNRVIDKGNATTPPTVEVQAFDTYIPIGLSSKKTGASFKTPRGRRPVGA